MRRVAVVGNTGRAATQAFALVNEHGGELI